MNEMMNGRITAHNVNDYVIYRKNGICKIVDIRYEDFGEIGESLYYVMQTVYDENSVIYVPVAGKELEQNMRRVLSVDEIHSIIDDSVETERCWVEDSKTRVAAFTKLLNQGDRADVLWLVKVLSLHKADLEAQKKKLSVSDTKILSAALKLINEEFSFVLGIPQNDVIPYIMERVDDLQTALCAEKDGA